LSNGNTFEISGYVFEKIHLKQLLGDYVAHRIELG
jgi:hypothetical protein